MRDRSIENRRRVPKVETRFFRTRLKTQNKIKFEFVEYISFVFPYRGSSHTLPGLEDKVRERTIPLRDLHQGNLVVIHYLYITLCIYNKV